MIYELIIFSSLIHQEHIFLQLQCLIATGQSLVLEPYQIFSLVLAESSSR